MQAESELSGGLGRRDGRSLLWLRLEVGEAIGPLRWEFLFSPHLELCQSNESALKNLMPEIRLP
jgi:hypothetical protein